MMRFSVMTMPTGAHSNASWLRVGDAMARDAYLYDIAGFSDPRIIEAGLHRTKKKRAVDSYVYRCFTRSSRREEFDR
jgi:hypothetical protein